MVPTVEEKTEEFDVCHIEPEKVSNQSLSQKIENGIVPSRMYVQYVLEKVCEEKEVEVAKHVCEEDEDSDAE